MLAVNPDESDLNLIDGISMVMKNDSLVIEAPDPHQDFLKDTFK